MAYGFVIITVLSGLVLLWVLPSAEKQSSKRNGDNTLRAGKIREVDVRRLRNGTSSNKRTINTEASTQSALDPKLPPSLEMMMAGRQHERPAFDLFDESGKVNSQALDAFHLSMDEVRQIQEATDSFRKQMHDYIANNTIAAPELATNNQEDVYRVKPFADDAADEFSKFIEVLTGVLGEHRSWEIAKTIPVEGIGGGMGRYEVIFRILDPSEVVTGNMSPEEKKQFFSIKYECRDPQSGEVISGGTSLWGQFNREFLGILE